MVASARCPAVQNYLLNHSAPCCLKQTCFVFLPVISEPVHRPQSTVPRGLCKFLSLACGSVCRTDGAALSVAPPARAAPISGASPCFSATGGRWLRHAARARGQLPLPARFCRAPSGRRLSPTAGAPLMSARGAPVTRRMRRSRFSQQRTTISGSLIPTLAAALSGG